jgi:hypothetical protein
MRASIRPGTGQFTQHPHGRASSIFGDDGHRFGCRQAMLLLPLDNRAISDRLVQRDDGLVVYAADCVEFVQQML